MSRVRARATTRARAKETTRARVRKRAKLHPAADGPSHLYWVVEERDGACAGRRRLRQQAERAPQLAPSNLESAVDTAERANAERRVTGAVGLDVDVGLAGGHAHVEGAALLDGHVAGA